MVSEMSEKVDEIRQVLHRSAHLTKFCWTVQSKKNIKNSIENCSKSATELISPGKGKNKNKQNYIPVM